MLTTPIYSPQLGLFSGIAEQLNQKHPLYLLAIISGFRGKHTIAFICSAIALIMAAIFPLIEGIATSESGGVLSTE